MPSPPDPLTGFFTSFFFVVCLCPRARVNVCLWICACVLMCLYVCMCVLCMCSCVLVCLSTACAYVVCDFCHYYDLLFLFVVMQVQWFLAVAWEARTTNPGLAWPCLGKGARCAPCAFGCVDWQALLFLLFHLFICIICFSYVNCLIWSNWFRHCDTRLLPSSSRFRHCVTRLLPSSSRTS